MRGRRDDKSVCIVPSVETRARVDSRQRFDDHVVRQHTTCGNPGNPAPRTTTMPFNRLLLTGAAGGLGRLLRPRLKRLCADIACLRRGGSWRCRSR